MGWRLGRMIVRNKILDLALSIYSVCFISLFCLSFTSSSFTPLPPLPLCLLPLLFLLFVYSGYLSSSHYFSLLTDVKVVTKVVDHIYSSEEESLAATTMSTSSKQWVYYVQYHLLGLCFQWIMSLCLYSLTQGLILTRGKHEIVSLCQSLIG